MNFLAFLHIAGASGNNRFACNQTTGDDVALTVRHRHNFYNRLLRMTVNHLIHIDLILDLKGGGLGDDNNLFHLVRDDDTATTATEQEAVGILREALGDAVRQTEAGLTLEL